MIAPLLLPLLAVLLLSVNLEDFGANKQAAFVQLAAASLAQQLPQVQPLPQTGGGGGAMKVGGQLQKLAPADSTIQASSREIEKQIVDKILGEGYDKRIRPAGSGPYNASRPGKFRGGRVYSFILRPLTWPPAAGHRCRSVRRAFSR